MTSDTKTLGVDLGTKRIGVALSDQLQLAAHPLTTLDRRGNKQDAATLGRLVAEHEVGCVVVGMPYGAEQEKRTAAFVEVLRGALAVPVEIWDERFSTVEAGDRMKELGVSRARRDARIDQEAAAVILQGWLDSRRKV